MILSIINAIDFPSWLREDVFTIGKFSLKWYGLGYIVGLVVAYLYALRLTKRRDIWIPEGATRVPEVVPTELMLSNLMTYCLVGIILGGRLGYVVLYAPETFLTPIEVFKIWTGGMSFHGGFLGVVAACAYASWKYKIDKFRIGDMASVGAPIGLGLVRVTNFMNQELYGNYTDVPWAVRFNAVNEYTGEKLYDLAGNPVFQNPRHPSQLYEALLEGLVLFLILRFMTVKYKALTKPGVIFGCLMFFYGLFRFSVEFVRKEDNIPQLIFKKLDGAGLDIAFEKVPDNVEGILIISRGMLYSLPMVVAGAILIIWANKRAPVSPKRPPAEAA